MTNEYLIEKFNISDFDKLIPLMHNCFGMEVNLEYFKWKFINNPAGKVIAFVAKDTYNNIVAFEGLIPEIYLVNGKEQKIYQSVDSMTHRSHRRKGLFKKLSFACYNHITNDLKEELLVTGFGGEESTQALLKLGWSYVFTVYFHFRFRWLIKFNRLFNFKNSHTDNYSLSDISDLSEILKIYNRQPRVQKIEIVRNEAFIKWRISNPRFNYFIKGVFNKNSELVAFAIFYIENRKVMLFDAVVDFNDKPAGVFLFKWLDSQVVINNYKGIVTFAQENTAFSELLKNHGYIINKTGIGPMKFKLPFVFYTNQEQKNSFVNKDFWAITPFDHDAF